MAANMEHVELLGKASHDHCDNGIAAGHSKVELHHAAILGINWRSRGSGQVLQTEMKNLQEG